jgi:hypothetical protein
VCRERRRSARRPAARAPPRQGGGRVRLRRGLRWSGSSRRPWVNAVPWRSKPWSRCAAALDGRRLSSTPRLTPTNGRRDQGAASRASRRRPARRRAAPQARRRRPRPREQPRPSNATGRYPAPASAAGAFHCSGHSRSPCSRSTACRSPRPAASASDVPRGPGIADLVSNHDRSAQSAPLPVLSTGASSNAHRARLGVSNRVTTPRHGARRCGGERRLPR